MFHRIKCSALAMWLAMLLLVPAVQAADDPLADNKLSEQEKAEGYILLFNGHDFEGWRSTNGRNFSKWIVEDGAIRTCLFGGQAKFVAPGSLYTTQQFQNFVLKLDFRIPSKEENKGTHSGVILRAQLDNPDLGDALEFEIYGLGHKSPWTTTGSFSRKSSAVKKQVVKTDGGWNSLVLTVNNQLIKAELNGELVNELDLSQWTTPGIRPDGEPGGPKKIAFKDLPSKGAIGLRDDHGNPIWYKNLKLKPLK